MPNCFASQPSATECREAVWSQGRACLKCDHAYCYRAGWTAEKASADNRRRVAEKRGDRC